MTKSIPLQLIVVRTEEAEQKGYKDIKDLDSEILENIKLWFKVYKVKTHIIRLIFTLTNFLNVIVIYLSFKMSLYVQSQCLTKEHIIAQKLDNGH